MEPLAKLSTQNPWPGLRAFTENDREFFFGRERETSELLELVQRSSVAVLYGQSGLGKTSVLQAGLLPDLQRLDFLPVRVRFDHSEEAPPLSKQIKNELVAELNRVQISSPPPAPNETLWEYFHRRDIDLWGPRNRLLTPVIILDQFEEVFTLGQRSENSATRVAQFAAELEAVLEHRPPVAVRERLEANPDDALHYDLHREAVKFLISLREDFLPELDPWRARMPSLLPNRFRLERMTGAQALEVVQRGGRDLVDAEVAHDIVDFVSRSQRAHSVRSVEQRDVEPALLSVVCDELNRRRIVAGRPQITADLLSHEREEIIQSFYERAFDDIDPRVRDWVEDGLLTASGYRNRAALEDALKEGLPEAAFDQLVNGRVLHREERAGVVWLELTHDLLSDPASRSRTAREQRRQAEEARLQNEQATQREAQLRVQLKKSRRQTTVFGCLLLGTAVALGLAVVSWRSDLASRRKAEGAEQGRKQSYQTAADMAERLSFGIGGGNWVPAATVLYNIRDAKKAYENLSGQASLEQTQRLNQEHARFLTKAADSFFEIGHVEEGLADANAALEILDHSGIQGTDDAARLLLVEARYEKGAGLLATGKVSAAKSSFENALKMVKPIPNSDVKRDFARVYVLSQVGLGEAEIQEFKLTSADAHFRDALDFATTYGSEADEILSWQVRALQGRGMSQWNDEEAGKFYDRAADILGTAASAGNRNSLTAHDPGNPRWKMMVTDLTYWQGWSLLRMGRYEAAKRYLEDSETEARELCSRDCSSALDPREQASIGKANDENWQWRLLLLQAWKGLGLARYNLREWDSSQSVLQQADTIAEELNQRQPSWTHALYLHAAVEQNLGQLQAWKYSQYSQSSGAPGLSFSAKSDPKLFEDADDSYKKSQNILMKNGYSGSEDREFVRLVYLALWDQGALRAAKADACRGGMADLCVTGSDRKPVPKEKRQEAADQLDWDALGKYREASRQLQPIAQIVKESAEVASNLAALYSSEGKAFNDLKRYHQAILAYESAVHAFEHLLRLENTSGTYEQLSAAHISFGDVYQALHDLSRAQLEFSSAMEAITKALEHSSKDKRAGLLGTKSIIHHRFADLLFKQGDLKASLLELEKAVTTDWEALNTDYASAWLNGNLKIYRTGSGTSLDTIEKAVEAPTPTDRPPQSHLTPEQSKALLKQINSLRQDYDPARLLNHYGQTAAALRPMLPGAWRAVPDPALARKHMLAAAKNLKAEQIRGIRELPLDFYSDAVLYEADIEMADGTNGIVDCVRRGNETLLLEGSFDQIREMNKTSPPRLDTPKRAIAYLRFVLGQMHNQDSARIQLIDQPEDIDWLPSTSASDRSNIVGKIKPLIVERSPTYDGDWQAIGSAAFGGRLDIVSFRLSRDGNVSIAQEKYAAEDLLPIFVETFSDGIRLQTTVQGLEQKHMERDLAQVKAHPSDLSALKELVAQYGKMKRWKEAADTQKNVIARLQGEESTNKAEHSAALFDAYYSLAIYQISYNDFAGALASGDLAKKLDATDLRADRMRAYALLLLGRTQEADVVYVQNVGKKIGSNGWEELVLADFKDLEAKGVNHREIDHAINLMDLEQVQQLLKATPDDLTSLRSLSRAYFRLKRWDEAVGTEKKAIAQLERERSTRSADRSADLFDSYIALSVYQLFSHDFAGALDSSDLARKLDATDLRADRERAHALLLLGHTNDAEAIYLQNVGKKIESSDWKETIFADFKLLKANGLSHPEVDRIQHFHST